MAIRILGRHGRRNPALDVILEAAEEVGVVWQESALAVLEAEHRVGDRLQGGLFGERGKRGCGDVGLCGEKGRWEGRCGCCVE